MTEAESNSAAELIGSYFRTLFWLIVGCASVIVVAEIAIWIWFGIAVSEMRQLIDANKCKCSTSGVTTSGNTITIQGQRTREDSILEIAKQIQQGQRNDVSGNQRTVGGTGSSSGSASGGSASGSSSGDGRFGGGYSSDGRAGH